MTTLRRLSPLWIGACFLLLAACNMVATSDLPTATVAPTNTEAPTLTPLPSITPRPTSTPTQPPSTGGGSGPVNVTPLPVINQPGGPPNDVCSTTPRAGVGTVNIRAGGGLNFPVIALLQTHAQVLSTQGGWFQILFPWGGTGWVSGSVVDLIGACAPFGGPNPGGPPQPETFCHFYPYGVNGNNIDLRVEPNGAFLAYVPAGDFIVTGQSGAWVRVLEGTTGQQGWILRERGSVTGNCDGIDVVQTSASDPCRISSTADTVAYVEPDESSATFTTFYAGQTVEAIGRTDDGWFGYDPGFNWIPPDVTGTARLRWLPAGNSLGSMLTTSGPCGSLPVVSVP